MTESKKSSGETYYTPSEVTAKVNKLVLDVITKAEMVLKQLPQHGAQVMVTMKGAKHVQGSEEHCMPHLNQSLSMKSLKDAGKMKKEASRSSGLILNKRPGVHYLYHDRFFKCGERNLVAREIWPSDGGCIELDHSELRRFILNNEAKKCYII
ncbi:unnamed protein product [Thelazia callipaeda]|uniref:DUF4283 domain-containing protein n=1 Tax=Thelazia callipaeda TaxID=103827 RepID=A0A0N5D3J3_THECL|nr:unnamed protein product [Thelazia callipaeda]